MPTTNSFEQPPESVTQAIEPEKAKFQTSISEVRVGRDVAAEMAVFDTNYRRYRDQLEKERVGWFKPVSNEITQLEKAAFGSLPTLHKGAKREITERDQDAYMGAFWKRSEAITRVWKDLEVFESDPSLVTPENCAKLLSNAWSYVENTKATYGDYPSENKGYLCVLNEVFTATLDTISAACQDISGIEKQEIAQVLKDFVMEAQDYNTWYFDRVESVAECVLTIEGVNGLQDAQDIVTELEKSRERLVGSGDVSSTLHLERSITESAIDETYLEFDESDHYLMHMHLVNFVGSKDWTADEKGQVADFLCGFMEQQSAGSLGAYVTAFQNLGMDTAVQPLLANLKNENVLARRMSAEILFRLEMGKVGVTAEGAEYLGKLYDLEKYNDPDFFVRRLNNSGLMAVLSQKGDIEGVFPLDLYSDTKKIQAEVRQLMSQELFLPKADETPAQRATREDYLQLFLKNYEHIFNDNFFAGTGVRLNSLDLHEQGWFIVYYSQASEAQKEQLRYHVTDYGELGLKVFLALDYGELGDKLLQYTEASTSSETHQRDVMKQFYKIANSAFEWRTMFEHVEVGLSYKFSSEVHEALIRKCSEYFRAALLIDKGESGEVTLKELLESMQSVSYALDVLKGLYEKDSMLVLEEKPQAQSEFGDKDGKNVINAARTTWTLLDKSTGSRVVVSVRPEQTVAVGNRPGGEARINFKVTNKAKGIETRIGVDLSDYGDHVGDAGKKPVVSLDLGTGSANREANSYPSQRVGRVLGLVEGSEGGHNEASFSLEAATHFKDIAHQFVDYMNDKFEL